MVIDMEWLVDNWTYIFAGIVVVACAVLYIVRFCKLSDKEKYERIQGWLLQAVIIAEREFGSSTGKLKLSFVYDKFCEQLPWLAKVIPFAVFSAYVDDALETMRNLISSNSAIASVVEHGDGND